MKSYFDDMNVLFNLDSARKAERSDLEKLCWANHHAPDEAPKWAECLRRDRQMVATLEYTVELKKRYLFS